MNSPPPPPWLTNGLLRLLSMPAQGMTLRNAASIREGSVLFRGSDMEHDSTRRAAPVCVLEYSEGHHWTPAPQWKRCGGGASRYRSGLGNVGVDSSPCRLGRWQPFTAVAIVISLQPIQPHHFFNVVSPGWKSEVMFQKPSATACRWFSMI